MLLSPAKKCSRSSCGLSRGISCERVAGGGSLGEGLGSPALYPKREELANRAIRMFSSVKPLPCGLAEAGDLPALLVERFEVFSGGGGARLAPGPFDEISGVSLTIGEY